MFMKKFKKIYIEITNGCNLNCSFCIGNKRKVQFVSFDDFKLILSKIKPYTDYLYFHILGEPLMHPDINKFINYAYDNGFKVNITTNGYLIDKIKNNKNIRQINISLHSFDNKYGVGLNEYLSNIFDSIACFSDTYISLRIWVNSKYCKDILDYIVSKYDISNFDFQEYDNFKICDNVFLSQFHEFIWPDMNNSYYCEKGRCYGLIDHIGILSDGSIVPCCLDSNGNLCLGNIFNDRLEDVLNSSRVDSMVSGFKNNYKCEEFCRHCKFIEN